MSEQIHHLIKMANQIAANFAHEQDTDAAALALANHLTRFWTSAMRQQIVAYAGSDGGELLPLARRAMDML